MVWSCGVVGEFDCRISCYRYQDTVAGTADMLDHNITNRNA